MKPTIALFTFLTLFYWPSFGNGVERWANRPNVIRAAERLASEVEKFDEALHDINAPTHVVHKVHHFEETVQEFAFLSKTASYQQAYAEFSHIRADFAVIRQEVNSHPELMANYKVAQEYSHMRTAYRSVDHEMFVRNLIRWSPMNVEKLMLEIKELESAHK